MYTYILDFSLSRQNSPVCQHRRSRKVFTPEKEWGKNMHENSIVEGNQMEPQGKLELSINFQKFV